ncbi:hypothetical protein NA647_13580 [Pseudomonas stutzeri]|uniref:hypothetical protein n=1 Tax=Stutzerimonas stutzeri TaxID=316 RepID=UPI0021095008|nr:hypothetical protein [Stutzerimonas stutzeri]MCQ4288460.1 hypothetical protein [Stutzerimonas stutzeri]
MKHTLVAAFATLTDATRTQGDLMSRGIAQEQIHSVGAETAQIHAYDEPYSTTDSTVDREHHESKVAHFFKSLFGHEPHDDHRRHATAYPEAVRRGSLVIAVDVYDEDQLIKARDALEYNGAISIDGDGAGASGTSATTGYAGPTSPYAGATGGDSHLDKHFAGTRTTATSTTTSADARHAGSGHLDTGTPMGGAVGTSHTTHTAATDHADSSIADTSQYDFGSAAKRAGTDYPETTATASPTGGGLAGETVATHDAMQDTASSQAGTCSDRVCVIRRPS